MSERPGLYLHLPFCSAICPYCDFAVTTGSRQRRREFVSALEQEIGLIDESWEPFDTVYLGGGTPSLLELADLERLLAGVGRRFRVSPEARLFLEANPEDASPEALTGWRRLGVATLSLGIQSFDREALAVLGRRHSPGQARAAVREARAAGFDTVSIDLIYAVPGRSPATWDRDLATAIELAPDHVSCYQLTFHTGTPFGRWSASGRIVEPGEDQRADLFFRTHETLAAAGYEGYEVSNFARGGEHRSRHNRKYWGGAPYLGLGPSAHSYDGTSRRWWNRRDPSGWQAAVVAGERPVAGEEVLDRRGRALEIVMLGLRTREGVDLGELDRRLDLGLVVANRRRLERWRDEGLVELAGERVAPTLRGLAVADRLAAELEI